MEAHGVSLVHEYPNTQPVLHTEGAQRGAQLLAHPHLFENKSDLCTGKW